MSKKMARFWARKHKRSQKGRIVNYLLFMSNNSDNTTGIRQKIAYSSLQIQCYLKSQFFYQPQPITITFFNSSSSPSWILILRTIMAQITDSLLFLNKGTNKIGNSLTLMDKDQEDTKDILSVELNLEETINLAEQLLNDLIESQGSDSDSIFNNENIPAISLGAYLRRIHKYTHYSPECLIIAIIYLDRYNIAEENFEINWYNVHRLFLTCLMLAVKFHDDVYFDNCSFQRGGGVSTSQLMEFQMQVFEKLGFSAFVENEEYQGLVQKLMSVYCPQ